MSISQQTTTENANAHAQLKLGLPILADRGGRTAQLFGARWGIPELLRDIHRKSGIDLPLLDRDARVGRCRSRPASSSMGQGSSPTPRSTPASPAAPRGETSCQCWTTCAACAPLEPRTAKHRGAPTGIRASSPQAFRARDLRAAPPPEATAPAIRHDSTRKASR